MNFNIASAKNPRKWAKLFNFRAAFIETPLEGANIPPVRIALPDGNIVTTQQLDLNQVLSNVLERDVTIGTTPPGKPSLEEYWPDIDGLANRETTTDESIPPGAFFDSAVIHLLTTATIDRLGELYPQGDLPKDPGILRTAAQHNEVNVGIYASVLQGGTIFRDDPVRLE